MKDGILLLPLQEPVCLYRLPIQGKWMFSFHLEEQAVCRYRITVTGNCPAISLAVTVTDTDTGGSGILSNAVTGTDRGLAGREAG